MTQTTETLTRREGFGGRTSTTWAAKWRNTPSMPIRLPQSFHEALTEIARQADQQPDPIAWLRSLRPAPVQAQEAAIEEGQWEGYNVAQLRQIARERGLKTARNANRAELLQFLTKQ
ncbi:hypothetical protein H6F46_06805 [Limnothrix sp. FACHB-1083]|uniref:hypothetical protein n=1 Tax=unclassified Limnothrix TaxID=2632864 RepID=UPI00168103E4|nr:MULTISPECIES: hypothetical protein [unclassified Limnothrix]MBD2160402.1 hypothetical protein [Limnothrix sp. FACHB-1083]MBD2191103.1 hypothetical protein [Limnothrix sp. FACHB-1088]